MVSLAWIPKFYWTDPYQSDREFNLTKKHYIKIKKTNES